MKEERLEIRLSVREKEDLKRMAGNEPLSSFIREQLGLGRVEHAPDYKSDHNPQVRGGSSKRFRCRCGATETDDSRAMCPKCGWRVR